MKTLGLSCLVEVYSSLHSKPTGNCSGILLDSQNGIILSHASVLLPSLGDKSAESVCRNLTDEQDHRIKARVTITKNISLPSGKKRTGHKWSVYNHDNVEQKCRTAVTPTSTSDCCQSRKNETTMEEFEGYIKAIWKADGFAKTLKSLMPQTAGWKFLDDESLKSSDDIENKESHKNFSKTNEPNGEQVYEWLPYFVLIQMHSWMEQRSLVPLMTDGIQIGEKLCLEGTPFGSMSPGVFLNSVSMGIVSNIAGLDHELILTDARAIPGSEGGAVYISSDNAWRLAGIVVAPLCWKTNEWVGLTICCSLAEVLCSLSSKVSLQDPLYILKEETSEYGQPSSEHRPDGLPALVASIYQQVVLVKCGRMWGSGTLFPSLGLVLTCSHVICSDRNAIVRIVKTGHKSRSFSASVVYCTPAKEVFDLAVLTLHEDGVKERGSRQAAVDQMKIGLKPSGEDVYAIGHACFDEYHGLQPSVSMGTISKVIARHQHPVMIQSTCVVHAGLSGGPLVAKDGTIVGIVASNARDTVSGASFPHINMSIPMATVWPLLYHYIKTKDSSILQQCHVDDSGLKSLWNLVDDGKHSLSSRL